MPRTPTLTYGDSHTVGQLAQMWEKSPDFVRRLVNEGRLATDGRGLVTNAALRQFYAQHGTLLDV